jgi:AcrR family transcriptional regulator
MTDYSRSSSQSASQPGRRSPRPLAGGSEPQVTAKSGLRRQPSQERSRVRVEAILDAAALVFDEIGYEAATTHTIADRAGTAIGSLYQFFPDKAAIFHAMELRHLERVQAMWATIEVEAIAQLPLQSMIRLLIESVEQLFSQPVSRVVFIQFFVARQLFATIDDRLTEEAIAFLASILQARNRSLDPSRIIRLAEVCVHSSNALILIALRTPDRPWLSQEIEDLLVRYLEPDLEDGQNFDAVHVMKVMKCPSCQSSQLSKNGRRRGKQCYLCKDCRRQFVANCHKNGAMD